MDDTVNCWNIDNGMDILQLNASDSFSALYGGRKTECV